MKSNEKLLMALSWIDEDLIDEAYDTKRHTRIGLKWFSTIAALFVFVFGTSLLLRMTLADNNKGGDSAPSPDYSNREDCEDVNSGLKDEVSEQEGEEDKEENKDTDKNEE